MTLVSAFSKLIGLQFDKFVEYLSGLCNNVIMLCFLMLVNYVLLKQIFIAFI